MRLKYLGTAAAEGIPALFCDCPICRNALAVRGREVKTRSQTIVDDRILIDLPADTYLHVLHGGLDLREVHTLIVTHAHSDHFYERDLWCRFRSIAYGDGMNEPLRVYATAGCLQKAAGWTQEGRVQLHEIRPFEAFEADGYRFVPLRANHDAGADPVIYIIEQDGRRLLYANDTGIFPEETWAYLATYGHRFDMVSIDCTGMLKHGWRDGHLCLETCAEVRDRLADMGLCDGNTVLYVNHFSHNGGATHEELVKAADAAGFGVSYDGCEVEF